MSDRTALALSARLEQLSAAAGRSGASAQAIAQLLEAASVATMNAVALDALTDETARPAPPEVETREPAVVAELRDAA